LTGICKILNGLGSFEILLEFLVLSGDHVRAGLTYVKLFLQQPENSPQEIPYLEKAQVRPTISPFSFRFSFADFSWKFAAVPLIVGGVAAIKRRKSNGIR
jgi:hypothetical protein